MLESKYTGYTFSFPFLSVNCGLQLQDMFLVQPLYKHLININHPTMAIVGLQICAYSYMYDLQVWDEGKNSFFIKNGLFLLLYSTILGPPLLEILEW